MPPTLQHQSPPKVAQILYSGLGGHGGVAFALAEESLKVPQWKPAMIFFGIEPLLEDYRQRCRSLGIEHRQVTARRRVVWMAWPRLVVLLHRLRPDCIILHSVKAILPCKLYAAVRGIPVIAVEHQSNALKTRKEWWVSRCLRALANAVVVLTPEYGEELDVRLGQGPAPEKWQVITTGIDTDKFRPSPRHIGRQAPSLVAGMAARFLETKRQDLLVDAIALLHRNSNQSWQLTLAGSGETLQSVRRRAESLQVSDSVAFPGFLELDRLRAWFQGIDVYVHASDGETLSTSILQAMAMGLPIVASDVPGIRNLLAGDAGMLVSLSAEGFASALVKLAADANYAEKLATNARARALRDFGQVAMFAKYHELVQSLCAR